MNQGFDDRPKFKATCASCGDACEVPFKPNGSKPVYCRECFKKEGNGGETRSFGGETRSFERRTDDRGFNMEEKRLFKTSCDKCGNDCEVPFRPTGERPVYCRECFGKNGAPQRNDRNDQRGNAPAPRDNSAEQFRALNAKLDLIIKALNISVAKAPEMPAKGGSASGGKAEVKVEAKKVETLDAPKAPVAVKAVEKTEAKVEIKKVEAKKAEAVKAPAKKKAAAKKKK